MTRPSWDQYHLSMARQAATRSSCPRASVGCVLVRDNHILATGFNGSMKGAPSCLDIGCLHSFVRETGETSGCLRTIHSEVNALLQAARHGVSTVGATAYCTHSPCRACMMALVNAGISRILYGELYRISEHLGELAGLGVEHGLVE